MNGFSNHPVYSLSPSREDSYGRDVDRVHVSQCRRRCDRSEKVADLIISARSAAVYRSVQAGATVICHRGNCYVRAIALVAEIAIGGRAALCTRCKANGDGARMHSGNLQVNAHYAMVTRLCTCDLRRAATRRTGGGTEAHRRRPRIKREEENRNCPKKFGSLT